MVHTTAVNITKMFGITGRVISSSTACTTSSQSIGFGYEMVKYGTKINPLREEFPSVDPVPKDELEDYLESIKEYKEQLGQ